jgi:hypothetical protein
MRRQKPTFFLFPNPAGIVDKHPGQAQKKGDCAGGTKPAGIFKETRR